MPGPVLLAGQVRTTLGCLASAFAASSSASALALLPAHLTREAEIPAQALNLDLKQLSPQTRPAGSGDTARKRKRPELDVERAVTAAARKQARQRVHRSLGSGEERRTSSSALSAPLDAAFTTRPTTSPTPAHSRRRNSLTSFRVAPSRLDGSRLHTRTQEPRKACTALARPFSTAVNVLFPVLDRHDAAASGPPPFASPASPAHRYATPAPSPSRQSERAKAPEAPRQTEKAAGAHDVALPREPSVEAATMPGPSSSSQKPPRPPSPYGEINDLARHPLLYDPVLAPRFPIILCHGLYGFDVRGPGFFRLHYWGDLLKVLRGKIGAEVFVTAVPGTGSVKNRAQVLHKSLEDTPDLLNRDVNFVAHSMGGLDARYLISNIKPTLYHPRSLTTLCTPHRGSEFMAWCRANIGIGTEYESNEALNLRSTGNSCLLDEPDDTSIPLPFSLKAPLLSRDSVKAASKSESEAAEKERRRSVVSSVLPFNLSAGVTSYLLDLLDSPAYANLTPSFLRDAFNPSTPDRDDVRYFSIAARTPRIPIWHPLWLPKLVLDGAEKRRVELGKAAPPEWRGNDGLVSVDSARWGEFLGTFDLCDHWEMRGSSGLSTAEASKHAVEQVTRRELRDSKEPHQGGPAEKVAGGKEDRGWQWQDVYALVGKLVGVSNGNGNGKSKSQESPKPANFGQSGQVSMSPPPATLDSARAPASPTSPTKSTSLVISDADSLASAASWIIRQLPGAASKDLAAAVADPVSPKSICASPEPTFNLAARVVKQPIAMDPAVRLMYGAPVSSASSSSASVQASAPRETKPEVKSTPPPAKPEKFSLERMAMALCRKLHNEGL